MMEIRPTIAVLATLDTKGVEAQFLREQIEQCGGRALLVDIGVIDPPTVDPDMSRADIAIAGGGTIEALLKNPTRQSASPVMIAGASQLLGDSVANGTIHGVVAMGGTQGTSNCTAIMRNLPYGIPKVMVSTIASGDVSSFVDIKDITMMFSVCDILGLNPLTRRILANAAAAVTGMAARRDAIDVTTSEKPTIAISNLGVLTDGTMHAIERFEAAGCEVMVFHAVGSGGRAMEQLMREGVIDAVFDYAMGEISDELFGGLRAADETRLTVASELGLPQVIVPGGAEHIGLMVEPDTVPPEWEGHLHVFHNPVIFAPRLSVEQLLCVGEEIGARLVMCPGKCVVMLPRKGVSRYTVAGGPLHDQASEDAFLDAIKEALPATVQCEDHQLSAEDHRFVDVCVDRLLQLLAEHAESSH